MRVYLLSDYDEHGSENMIGTTDPAKLEAMMRAQWPNADDDDVAGLRKLLAAGEAVDGQDLARGWGGIQMHILDIE